MSARATVPGADTGVRGACTGALGRRLWGVRPALLFSLVVALWGPASAAAGLDQWLLMVRTLNKDSSRTVAFNDWYDHIDVPDVLKVPGFERARRGQVVSTCSEPVATCGEEGQRYVALYDIGSKAIDKTIIDMLMATWKMLRSGRDTPLLEVEERAYYHETSPPRASGSSPEPSARTFLLLERFDVEPPLKTGDLGPLIERQARLIRARSGSVTVTRYELYRVLMFEPREAPRLLTVYEFPADSSAASEQVKDALSQMAQRQRSSGYLHAETLLYEQLSDVKSDGRQGSGVN